MRAYVRLALALGVTALLGAGLYLGAETGWGRLQPVEIVMAPDSNQPQLFARIQDSLKQELKTYEGKWLWQARLPTVLDLVLDDRRVQAARVKRVFPNRLQIEIAPHRPVLAWADRVGRLYPVAADASLLPALPLNETPDMPLLRGKEFQEEVALREQAIRLMGKLPADGALARERIAEITYSVKEGFALLLTEGGTEVRLGEDDIDRKTERVERVLRYLQDQRLRGRVIDARFSKKVVVRLRNAP